MPWIWNKVPESVCLQTRKRVGHAGFGPGRHDLDPVQVERVDQFKGGFDEVFRNRALRNQIHERQQQKGFMGGSMQGKGRIPAMSSVGSQIGKSMKIVIQHNEPFAQVKAQRVGRYCKITGAMSIIIKTEFGLLLEHSGHLDLLFSFSALKQTRPQYVP